MRESEGEGALVSLLIRTAILSDQGPLRLYLTLITSLQAPSPNTGTP